MATFRYSLAEDMTEWSCCETLLTSVSSLLSVRTYKANRSRLVVVSNFRLLPTRMSMARLRSGEVPSEYLNQV